MSGIEPHEIEGILRILAEQKSLYERMLELSSGQGDVLAEASEKDVFELISEKNRVLNLIEERMAELSLLKEKWDSAGDIDPVIRVKVEDAFSRVRVVVEKVMEAENEIQQAAIDRHDKQGDRIKKLAQAKKMNLAYKQMKDQSKYLDLNSNFKQDGHDDK